MRTVFIILLIAVIAVFTQRKKAPQAATYIIAALVAAILALQGGAIFRASRGPGPGLIEEFHEAAGWKLGRYVVEACPSSGKVLVIQTTTREGEPVSTAPAQLAGIQKALEGTHLYVTPVSMTFQDAHWDPAMMGGPITRNDAFLAALESEPDAEAVICCVNVPYLLSDPPDRLPPLFLLETGDRFTCEGLMSAGIVHGAVLRRPGVGRGVKPKRGMSPDEIFALRYDLITR